MIESDPSPHPFEPTDPPTPTQLVESHLSLVDHLVRERLAHVPAHVRRDELRSAGLLALVASAQAYDAARGVPFPRFAAIRIRGALVDELRGMDWAPRSLRCRARDVEGVVGRLASDLQRPPYPHEVAAALRVEVRELAALESALARASVVSLHTLPAGLDREPALEESDGPETVLLRREQLGCLGHAVAALPDRLRTVVLGYFLEQRPMTELADELGVTQSRVSQLCSQALALLRVGIDSQLDPAYAPGPATGRADRARARYVASVAARVRLARPATAVPPLAAPVRPRGGEQVA